MSAESSSQNPYKAKGFRRFWNALGYSLAGLRACWQGEAAFRQEMALACLMLPVALWLPVTFSMKAMLLSSVMLVLIVEVLNSAIEAVVDRVSLELNPLAKRAKDLGSAAVFLSLVTAGAIWGLGLWECWST